MDQYDVNASIKAQAEYCEREGVPHFAPKSGVCWNCRKNIYTPIEQQHGDRKHTYGITTEKAGTQLVTRCPHCNRTYCD